MISLFQHWFVNCGFWCNGRSNDRRHLSEVWPAVSHHTFGRLINNRQCDILHSVYNFFFNFYSIPQQL